MNKLPITQYLPAAASVQPELLAAKLAAIENLEYPEVAEQIAKRPRLVEMLWFLQWASFQKGGLRSFAQDLLSQFPQRVGTETLRRASGNKFSLEQKLTVFKELPERISQSEIFDMSSDFLACLLPNSSIEDLAELQREERRKLEEELNGFDRNRLLEICRREALRFLPQYLASLCNEPSKGFVETPSHWDKGETWFFEDVTGAVLEMMDLHARRASAHLAKTAVSEKVYDALNYAYSERCMVRIGGDSRFGKTESVKTWCYSRPGIARLATVPSSNTLMDLLRAIADALGVAHTYKTSQNELKAKVEYVIRYSRLFLVLDEGAFLLPQCYSRNTSPARLNWVRTEIVDKGLPLAIVVTPQSFHTAVNKFVRATSYAMEQFLGRTSWSVVLPSELDVNDLIAVAKVHFPEIDEDHLGLIAGHAMAFDNYLKAVEDLAKLARYFAKKEGRGAVTEGDLNTAIQEMAPARPTALATAHPDPSSVKPGPLRKKAQEHLKAPLTPVSREAKPPQKGHMQGQILGNRSLRGADLETAKAEEISAEA